MSFHYHQKNHCWCEALDKDHSSTLYTAVVLGLVPEEYICVLCGLWKLLRAFAMSVTKILWQLENVLYQTISGRV